MAELYKKFLSKGAKTKLSRPKRVSKLSTRVNAGTNSKVKQVRNAVTTLIGGPFDGTRVKLDSAGTMAFSVPSFDKRLGRYNNDGQWEFV